MGVPTWVWVVGAGGVLWYVNEQNRVKLAANRGVAGVVDHASSGANKVIDETFSAVGRWASSLFSGSGSSNSGRGVVTDSSGASFSPDYWDDYYDGGSDV